MRVFLGTTAIAASLLAAPAVADTTRIDAPLRDGAGAIKGSVAVRGNRITVKATGFASGIKGVHVHEAGLCQGPDFKSAGGHWNPMSKQHGRDNPMGAHVGDLPNMKVDARGRGTLTIKLPPEAMNRTVGGLSLVVHAAADDYRTDPSGNSGARLACAVIVPPLIMDR